MLFIQKLLGLYRQDVFFGNAFCRNVILVAGLLLMKIPILCHFCILLSSPEPPIIDAYGN